MNPNISDKLSSPVDSDTSVPLVVDLTQARPSGGATFSVTSTAGMSRRTPIHFVVFGVDNNGVRIENTVRPFKGIVTSNTHITSAVPRFTPDTNIPATYKLALAYTAAWGRDLVAGVLLGGSVDQTARDAAANAQREANNNAASITALDISSAAQRTSLANLEGRFDAGEFADMQSVTISTAASYQSTLNSQRGSTRPLLLVIDTAISGNRGGASYAWPAGQVIYFAPLSDSAEALFVLPQGEELADGAVNTAKLADNAVTEPKIANDAVTVNKIGDGAVTGRKLANGAASGDKIGDGSVTANKLTNNSVTTDKIVDGAVGHDHLKADAVETDNIKDGNVTLAKLAADARPTGGGGPIADGSVTTAKLADGAVTAAKIAPGVIPEAGGGGVSDIYISPSTFVKSAEARSLYILINSTHTDAANIQFDIGGIAKNAAYTGGRANLEVALAAVDVANLNRASSPVIRVQANIRDSSNTSLERLEADILKVDSTTPAPDVVLQDPVVGSDTAGVVSLALPANYTSYKHLSLAVWEGGQDAIVFEDIMPAVLAINPTLNIRDQTSARQNINIAWTTSRRTLTIESPDRFIYAALVN